MVIAMASHSLREIASSLKLISNYSKVFLRSLPLLWKAAPREIFFLIVITLLQGFIPSVGIWINKQVVDTVAATLNSTQEYSVWNSIALVASWVIAILLQSLLPPFATASFSNVMEKLTARINILLIRKADSFKDLVSFEDSHFYDEIQLIQQEVNDKPIELLQTISLGFQNLLTFATMLVLLSPLGWWIPCLIVVTSFPQIYFSFKIRWDIWETMSEKSPQARRMQYYSSVMLSDTYAKEVRLFGLGSLFTNRYLEAFEDKYQAMRNLRGKQAIFLGAWSILSAGGNAFAFYWVFTEAIAGKLSSGNVLVFIQSLVYIQQTLARLLDVVFTLQETLLYMERLFKFLDSQPTLPISIPSKPIPSPMRSGITFKNVSFAYPDGRLALEKISFAIAPGETIALVGENGAGKTTLIKLLTRFYDPTAGEILIDNVNLKELDLEKWRRQIAVVFQDFCRYSLSVGENIALGNLNSLDRTEEIELAASKSGIAKKVDRLENKYQTLLGKQFDGTELSGGEWQKIAIARAFIRQQQSQLLVLDEPTAALDPRSEYEIYNRFSELVRGKMAILVTHRLASVPMSDRIFVLKAGKLIEQGTHQQLLQQQGEYANLWNMQAEAYQS
ncbi:MAG: ABC transporter ATP-binding protein [Xenococcaceae cyanobacterium]